MHSSKENIGKRCSECGVFKPYSEFCKAPRNRDGHQTRCKNCVNAKGRERYWRQRPGPRKRRTYGRSLKPGEWEEIIASGSMQCRTCGKEKPLSEFRPRLTRKKTYYYRDCRPCLSKREDRLRQIRREHDAMLRFYRRLKKYGITEQQYKAIFAEQQGVCAICMRPLDASHRVIDHDHHTGKVRGIIHNHCNLMIGNAGDDVTVLAGGIRYLKKHQSKNGT